MNNKKSIFKILSSFFMIFVLVGCGKNKENSLSNISSKAENVNVSYINVGKGDAILVQIDDKNYLIDTGLEENSEMLLEGLKAKDVDTLDGVFLTHTHKDHIGGMEAVAAAYDIEMMYRAEISENKKNGENKIDNLSEDLYLPITKLNAGDKVKITDDIYFDVIGPLVLNEDDDNDNSLVMKLVVNGKTFLFTGDMQFAEEKTLMDAGVDLSSDILKVGNHGNKDATSDEFAIAVSPKYSVITTDTTVDTNSASKRVRKALSTSEIYITENYDRGITFTVLQDGTIEIAEF
ncbi:MBL fold metallo-hydrolase [Clostridium sp. NSJ-145]|uniref:ComEC/Rec2 family competence protein n=1 Tax=Clostridium sp. NSJ-145 TaxID=2897777 RepID=UPI001E4C4D6C|nr:MBL fold metallo-hydrolase [Clostridium sp. NSJ-145]MCD2501144.1 MBL fold metallo-hydrolase [Clostridium sp. NSJ-145]